MGKGTKISKKPASTAAATAPATKSRAGASDALRQAIKDLGGDDSDLDLIAGIDSDDEEAAPPPSKGKGKDDEKSIKDALGKFMKGLDFGAVGGAATVAADDEEEEEDDDEDDEEDDDEDDEDNDEEEEEAAEEEEDEEEEDEDEDDEEEAESDAESEAPEPVKPTEKKAAPKAIAAKATDSDPKSGRNIPPVSAWWTLIPELSTKPLVKPQSHTINILRQKAERLLAELPPPNRSGSSSDANFINQILSSGTHQDKLSALTLIVRESPIHAISELERLRSMAGWRDGAPHTGGGRDQRMATVRALADWWTTGGGMATGKLRYFADQPLLAHPDVTDRHLVVYAFEDFLKKWFFNVLQILEVLSHDTLPYVRMKALDATFSLLAGNAEQEQNLLRLGVNKLGDTDRSVASKVSHHILQLLQVHPAMKTVIAREVTAIVLKTVLTGAAGSSAAGAHMRFDDGKDDKKDKDKDVSTHGRYYGLITLNQMTLTSKDKEVAGKLVEVYFEVFREILGDEQSKGEDKETGEKVTEKVTGKVEKWRGRKKGAKPKGGRKTATEDELVESADAKLVAAVLTGINRALPFAKIDDALFTNYMDTLFKICHGGTFNTSIQALQLIFQVCQSRQTVNDRFYRTLYESLFDPRLLTSSKQAMYLNLLFKALKVDPSLPRVMAFVKRLLQMLGVHQPPFICGALYLLGELFNTTPGLRRMLIEPEDDGEEHFVDADKVKKVVEEEESKGESSKFTTYDGRKREPLYAHADTSCLWELVPFLNHFHPSVSLQASQLLMGQPITGSPDISLNTLISFLDKFVYRNPKKTAQPKGASIMQPAAITDQSGVVRTRGPRTDESAFVNSEAFWRKKVEDVPVDQMFFHKFFSTKLAKKDAANKKKSGKADSDAEDSDMDMGSDDGSAPELPSEIGDETDGEGSDDEMASDPEEDEIWKAMKASMPEVGDDMGLSEDDSSDDDVDVDYSDDEDEAGEGEGEEDDEDEDEAASDADSDSSGGSFPSFDDDEDDLISMDEMDDVVLGGDESEPEVEEDAEAGAKRKRREERKERKKKRKEMPAFASYEDYAALIEQAGDDQDE